MCLCLCVRVCVCACAELPGFLRWCVLSNEEQRKCVDMAQAFRTKGLTPSVQCVYGASVPDCLAKIKVITAVL